MDYNLIGEALVSSGKQIQKLNSKLDKVLEKQIDLEGLGELKAKVIEQVEADDFESAEQNIKELKKLSDHKVGLDETEKDLRAQLEALVTEAAAIASGNVPESSSEATSDDSNTKDGGTDSGEQAA